KMKVNFSGTSGFNTATFGNLRIMDSQQLYNYQKTFWDPATFESDRSNNLLDQNTDWVDLAFRTGVTHNYSISVSGSTPKTQMYISGNYYKEEGTLHNNHTQNFNIRSNITHQISSKLKLEVKLNAVSSDFETETSESNYYTTLYAAFTNLPWDNPY